ncbi:MULTISPECIES: hypothetical protein [Sphingobacterium]|uniref:Uncharacterized protein n=1 Tax=Sphingobacterium athyrii TaxID=2152717 RepID=A0A363NRH6_9SPHI|nr:MULTISPECIES: hypothetical protein [Sphingobacterium]PUV23368.1 hypothetical protein DCO56_15680 [Sphingobacterium athyrii]QIH36603.1 hypothetical protein G6053_28775 [Sphingobacterium sp. DR205]
MPANKKYLSSPFQRFLKITAGFIGGYIVMLSFHVLLTAIFEKKDVVMTAGITGYLLWAVLMLLAFLSKSGWKIWGIYLLLASVFSLPYLLKM